MMAADSSDQVVKMWMNVLADERVSVVCNYITRAVRVS